MDLIEVLQGINQESYAGMKPTDLAFGTVQSLSPLTIQTESTMQPLPEEALILTDTVKAKSYSGTTSDGASFSVTINEGLAVGDRVVLLRCASGQRFIVLSKA
jgi:hypothetical protein